MNELITAIILGFIQGLTEFFPVSSSGHLLLIPPLLEKMFPNLDFAYTDNNFDVLLHLATFLAILWVYRQRLKKIFFSATRMVTKKTVPTDYENINLIKNLTISTIPIIIVGGFIFVFNWDERQSEMIGVISLISIGIVFVLLDLFPQIEKYWQNRVGEVEKSHQLSWGKALFIGLTEVAGVIRGVSRSGATLLGGILSGMNRKEALDYSFLMSIPLFTILTVAEVAKLILDGTPLNASLFQIIIGCVTAFLTAVLAIRFFQRFIDLKYILLIFGVYRIILGILIWITI